MALLGRTRTRRRSTIVLLLSILLLVMAFAPAAAAPPDNPFVGSWESFDDFYDPGDGFYDNSHVRLQISNTGVFRIRDEAANGCRTRGFGFVPATFAGTAEFVEDGTELSGFGDLVCFPRDGLGRTDVDTFPFWISYNEATDTLWDGGVCWWRTGTGDSTDCD